MIDPGNETITREEYFRRAAIVTNPVAIRRHLNEQSPMVTMIGVPGLQPKGRPPVLQVPASKHGFGCDGTAGLSPEGYCQRCGR